MTIWNSGLSLLLALQGLDLVLTKGILGRGGLEANPLYAAIYRRAGIGGLFALKIALVALVIWLALVSRPGLVLMAGIWGLIAFYGWALWQMWRVRRGQNRR